jgi:hypothetical protein
VSGELDLDAHRRGGEADHAEREALGEALGDEARQACGEIGRGVVLGAEAAAASSGHP